MPTGDSRLIFDDVPARLAGLAGELSRKGELRSEPWRAALLAVPRHVFLQRFYRKTGSSPPEWTPVTRELMGDQAWLDLVYADETWITQVAGRESLWDPEPKVQVGDATCSSSMPSLVVRMLESLGIHTEHRVLEIGTGTGYSTALLCHRLGEANVVSIEYDEQIALRATATLAKLGYHPTPPVGDGAAGYPDGAPYDRIITTCAFTGVFYSWVEQAKPGARILVIFSGSVCGGTSAVLDVHGDGTASGFLDARPLFFMRSRPQLPPDPPMLVIPKRDATRERATDVPMTVFDDPTFRFLLQARLPDLSYSGLFQGKDRRGFFRTPGEDPERLSVARVGDGTPGSG